MINRSRVLVVDRDHDSATSLAGTLSAIADAESVPEPRFATVRFRANFYHGLVVDERLPATVCLELIEACLRSQPDLWIVVLCSSREFEAKVAAVCSRAVCLLKPASPEALLAAASRLIADTALSRPESMVRFTRQTPGDATAVIGVSPAFQRARDRVILAARTGAPVLILGESGSGKDVLARLLHAESGKPRDRFHAVNSAGIPATLIESTLFGHKRGAFTGADSDRKGAFAAAHGGTLFLDEIGDMPKEVQASLLRAVETKTIFPVGTTKGEEADVRIVTATHRDLGAEVREGSFRADLYYRLAVWIVSVPPLRHRSEDIEPLATGIIERRREALESRARHIAPAALDRLRGYRWPGNVRELDNVMQRAMLLAPGDIIEAEHIEFEDMTADSPSLRGPLGTYAESDREFRRAYFRALLDAAAGSRSRAKDLAGVSRSTLHKHLKELGIE